MAALLRGEPWSLYDDLGVSKDARPDRATIKRQYQRAQNRIPTGPAGMPEKFHQITRAYDVLYDDARRAHYDQTGADGQQDKRGALTGAACATVHDADREA